MSFQVPGLLARLDVTGSLEATMHVVEVLVKRVEVDQSRNIISTAL